MNPLNDIKNRFRLLTEGLMIQIHPRTRFCFDMSMDIPKDNFNQQELDSDA